MKTKILTIFLVLFFWGNSLSWSLDDAAYWGTIMGTGAVLMLTPPIISYLTDEPASVTTNALCFGFGGAFILGGLIWMIIDIVDDNSSGSYSSGGGSSGDWRDVEDFSSRRKINPIIRHFSFGVLPDKVYIGANFKF